MSAEEHYFENLLMAFATFPIDISNLKQGLYIIGVLDNNNDIYFFKFLKK